MIIVEENKYILDLISDISDYKFKIVKKSNINKLKKGYNIFLISVNDYEDLEFLNNIKDKVIVFIRNIDENILIKIHKYCSCIDVININNSIDSIKERIISNLKKGEFDDKEDNNI